MKHATIVLLAAAIVIALVVAAQAEGTDPSINSGQAPSGIFFEATHLTSDLEGSGAGQIAPFGATFCDEGVCVVEPNAAISASLAPHCVRRRLSLSSLPAWVPLGHCGRV